mmetsp:Transcript_7899/g.19375  ORF Transcript_7899/g.19375 Transcript_7899/m.19375 type:complete len:82 (-) Transcript_7899:1310-1555(-)
MISSASLIVESRCAITKTLEPTSFNISCIAACTMCSFFASRLDVASSNKRIRGFAIKALAIAILCRCPPERLLPASPARVS